MRVNQFDWKLAVFVSVMLCAALSAAAQNVGVGAIAGNVTDASGAALPGATITLSSPQGTVGANQQTISDERGAYQLLRLPGRLPTSSRRSCPDFVRSSCATFS